MLTFADHSVLYGERRASGNGVNEMLDSMQSGDTSSALPLPLVKRMRRLIWVCVAPYYMQR